MTEQGARSNTHRLATIDDLDALLAQHSLAPRVVRLGGTDYKIRTDLTAVEVQQFVVLMTKGLDRQAFTLLVGTQAELKALAQAVAKSERGETLEIPAGRTAIKLNDYLESLPRMHMMLAMSRIMRASQVLAQRAKSEAEIYAENGYEPDVEPEQVESGESSAS